VTIETTHAEPLDDFDPTSHQENRDVLAEASTDILNDPLIRAYQEYSTVQNAYVALCASYDRDPNKRVERLNLLKELRAQTIVTFQEVAQRLLHDDPEIFPGQLAGYMINQANYRRSQFRPFIDKSKEPVQLSPLGSEEERVLKHTFVNHAFNFADNNGGNFRAGLEQLPNLAGSILNSELLAELGPITEEITRREGMSDLYE
jgi:hypothetical protein